MIVFPFMIQEQLITFSFCKIHGWSILIQSFAKFIMGDTYVDAKTVLDSVKSSTWKFSKFRMSGGEVDAFESIICRKLPYKYIYYVCETIND